MSLPDLSNAPPIIDEIIRDCFKYDPAERPTAEAIAERLVRWQFEEDCQSLDENGRTRLHNAVVADDLEKVKELLATNRVRVNAKDNFDKTPFMYSRPGTDVQEALRNYKPIPLGIKQPSSSVEYQHNIYIAENVEPVPKHGRA